MSTTTMEMSLSRCWDWLYCNFKITNAVHEAGPTFDAIDAARPKGWTIRIEQFSVEPCGWWGKARRKGQMDWRYEGEGDDAVSLDPEVFAPDLLACWARLCVAMWMAEGKA